VTHLYRKGKNVNYVLGQNHWEAFKDRDLSHRLKAAVLHFLEKEKVEFFLWKKNLMLI
jgi:hypothetical protein